MKFAEEKLERAFTELLGQEGYSHHIGISSARKPDVMLIEEELLLFIVATIEN
jgi:type I restriction enzyme R subunit